MYFTVERSMVCGLLMRKDEGRDTMKKRICLLTVLLSAVGFLTSCRVNWFDMYFDVPWWVIAIPVALFSVIVFCIAGKGISSEEYVCSECGRSFYPTFFQAFFSIHMGNDRYFRCPHCGKKGFCPRKRD